MFGGSFARNMVSDETGLPADWDVKTGTGWHDTQGDDLRNEVLAISTEGKSQWMETYHDRERWWIIDYVNRKKTPLRDIAIDMSEVLREKQAHELLL